MKIILIFLRHSSPANCLYVYKHNVILFLVCICIIGNSCKSSLRNNARYWILNVRYSLCTLHIGSSYDFIPCMLCKPSFYLEVGTDKSISLSFSNSIESQRYVFYWKLSIIISGIAFLSRNSWRKMLCDIL